MINIILNGICSDSSILQIIIQQKLEKFTKILKTLDFRSKLEMFINLKKKKNKKKKQLLALVFLVMKTRKNIHSMFQRILSKAMLSYY